MRFYRSLIEPGGRFLARHLRRLCQSLQNLGSRLRQGIASAAGQSAAEVVEEAVGNLLGETDTEQRAAWSRQQPQQPSNGLWGEPQEYESRRWEGDLDDPDRFLPEDLDQDFEPLEPAAQSPARRSTWLGGLIIGLQTAAWWLCRHAGRFPLLTALGCGLIAALIACGCGPLAAAGASLLSLAALLQTGAEMASLFTTD